MTPLTGGLMKAKTPELLRHVVTRRPSSRNRNHPSGRQRNLRRANAKNRMLDGCAFNKWEGSQSHLGIFVLRFESDCDSALHFSMDSEVSLWRLDHQMKMVGHQTIGMHLPS